MKYEYFKSQKGNFGDDLNAWLWPQLFHGEERGDDWIFLGIGSILHNENKSLPGMAQLKKIVFGTGVRPSKYYTHFKIDPSWDIQFLRGPLSSYYLGDVHEYITDAAYAIRQLPEFEKLKNQEKKYEISLMPYFHSVEYFDWEAICRELGFHYISPYSENGVEHTLQEIAASKMLITEAMHGAIAADLLRVPWHRFIFSTPHTEGAMISEFKWSDWLRSVEIHMPEVTFIPFYQKTRIHDWVRKISSHMISVEFLRKTNVRNNLIAKLGQKLPTYLSKDQVLEQVDTRIHAKVEGLKQRK